MGNETRTTALLLLLISVAAGLLGCGAASHIRVDCRALELDEPLGTQAKLVVLPVGYARETESEFASLAGELLAQAISEAGYEVVSPDEVSSAMRAAPSTSSSLSAAEGDALSVSRGLGAEVALVGTLTRCVYGHLNPSEIGLSVLVLDLHSGNELARVKASAESRKGVSYTRLSNPPTSPDALLAPLLNEMANVIILSLQDNRSRTVARVRRLKG